MTQDATRQAFERKNDQLILNKLEEIQRSQQEIRSSQQMLHVKLFGDVEEENEHGRIPRLEAKASNDNKRIGRLERWRWVVGGGLFVIGMMVELAAAGVHVGAILK